MQPLTHCVLPLPPAALTTAKYNQFRVLEASPGVSPLAIGVLNHHCFFFPPTLNLLSVALALTEGVRRRGSVPTGPEDSLEGLILLFPKRRDCQYYPNLTQGQDNGAATNPRGLVQDTAPPRSTDLFYNTHLTGMLCL